MDPNQSQASAPPVQQQTPAPNAAANGYSPYQYPMTPQQEARKTLREAMICPRGMQITLSILIFFFCAYQLSLTAYSLGLGLTLSILAYCVLSYLLLYQKSERKNSRALVLYLPIALIGAGFSLHNNPGSQPIMVLTLMTLVILQCMMLCNHHYRTAFSMAMVKKLFRNTVGQPIFFLSAPFRTLKFAGKGDKIRGRRVLVVIVGLLVAIPAVALLLWWFRSADKLFSDQYRLFFENFDEYYRFEIGDFVLGILFTLFVGVPVSAFLLYNHTKEPENPVQTAFGGPISALFFGTFLSVIGAVMLVFVAFQFRHFFFGQSSGAIAEMGYAEYAREGFFQLTNASIFVAAIVSLVFALCRRGENGKLPTVVRLVLAVICLANITILISAYLRMLLYVEAHGFSMKRLMTLWLMALIGVCMLVLLARCFIEKLNTLRWIATAVIVAVCALSVFNTDHFVAKTQVDRAVAAGTAEQFDTDYISYLSYSAMPQAARALESLNLSADQTRDLRHFYNDHLWFYSGHTKLEGFCNFTFDRLNIDMKIPFPETP